MQHNQKVGFSTISWTQSQLKAIYRDHADTIIGNCDTSLFLGGKEKSTLKDLSESLVKELLHLMVKSSVAQITGTGTRYF